MILIDRRVGSRELLSPIRMLGVPAELGDLEYGDCAMEGNGPNSNITIGIERKTLHDMLCCIDDSRYGSYQRPGMAKMYTKSVLAIEGVWRPHQEQGLLMELFREQSWGVCKQRTKPVLYSKLYRYLLSLSISGVIITHSRDLNGTAFNICEIYHYFQKRWTDHTSLIEVQKLNLPDLHGAPTLVRTWAAGLDGVGAKLSQDAEALFKSGYRLATSDETDWLKIPGIGIGKAQKIIKQIHTKLAR